MNRKLPYSAGEIIGNFTIKRTALRARICNLGWPIEKAFMVKHITKETTIK